MAYPFAWKGGTYKEGEHQTFKFFLFAMLEDETPQEIIHFNAVKRHIFRKESNDLSIEGNSSVMSGSDLEPYLSLTPIIKVFMSQKGFGIRQSYFSFFFRFTRDEGKIVTIRPFGFDLSHYAFRAKGRFLSKDEVKALVGEGSDTFRYYLKQTYLSKVELNTYVSLSDLPQAAPGKVRNIRV